MRQPFLVLERIALFAALAVGAGYGENDGENSGITFTPSGFASLREGQVVKGEPEYAYPDARADHVWVQEMDVGLNARMQFNNLPFTGNLGMAMNVGNDNIIRSSDFGKTRRFNFYPYLSRADLLYSWGDKENPSTVLDVGYFPFKYDDAVRNLGEYLFRSGTYPQYLVTDFDFPMARLMGARLSGSLFDKIKWDILATTNVEWAAIGDLNLSGLLAWKPAPVFELGLGGSWCSILSVNWDRTTPKDDGNAYVVDGKRYYYTFAGPKIMGRFTLDVQRLFPGNTIFGKQDLKLYSEAAILGLFNYPMSYDGYTQYDTLWQRIPVMAGFNVPTFKVLDVLSFEVEWFGNPYPNTLNPVIFESQPVPLSSYRGEKEGTTYLNNHQDDWKWSVYGKKTFFGHIDLTFQFARDHLRWSRLDYSEAEWKEALRENNEWYYTIKLGYTF